METILTQRGKNTMIVAYCSTLDEPCAAQSSKMAPTAGTPPYIFPLKGELHSLSALEPLGVPAGFLCLFMPCIVPHSYTVYCAL